MLQSNRQLPSDFDVLPCEIFAPVPPMLAEACGYNERAFGHPLDARYVGFYWEHAGDEVMVDDGRTSGTGEYSGFLAYVDHPKVAVHLRHCDWGSSETLPREMLVLDRTEHRLYAVPVRLAQHVLMQQWEKKQPSPEAEAGDTLRGGSLRGGSLEEPPAVLEMGSWQEVTPPGDFDEQVTAAMQRQNQLVDSLLKWLEKQQRPLTPGRIAEYTAPAYAMLLRHITEEEAFARAGELVHLQEVRASGTGQIMVSFYRDNGRDGPQKDHLFSVDGTWQDIAASLDPLLEPAQLDDLLESGADLAPVFGRYAAWNGVAFPIVPLRDTLAIRVSLPCARCGRNPTTVFAMSGLQRGAFCYVYDQQGEYLANLREQEYVCSHCDRSHPGASTAAVEQD